MQAVVVNEFGGIDKLEVSDWDRPEPGRSQVLVRLKVSGVNFIDVYQRSGTMLPSPGFVAGVEGLGEIVEVGEDVDHLVLGQRVGWLWGGQGSFAEYAVVGADKAVPIPDDITDDAATALLMQGVTAHYLATDSYRIRPGDPVLVHAASGGVGQLLTQVAKIRGAVVIGTASTEEKADIARAVGADHVIGYDEFGAVARRLTDGAGVAAVYDGVGAATLDGSLEALRPRGTLVVFGAASGPTPPVDVRRLMLGGSLFLTRPSVGHYIATMDELRQRTQEIFAWHAAGRLKVTIAGSYALADVAEAFEALESRRTAGKLLLRH